MLYPNADIICSVCAENGYQITVERFLDGFYAAIYRLDLALRAEEDTSWIPALAAIALEYVGLDKETASALAQAAKERTSEERFWSYTQTSSHAALQKLAAAGYRMSVISNADGTVEQQLQAVGLARYFEQIYDSQLVGAEKPDPRIFRHALAQLGLDAAECIYIGDLYCIDVYGANRVGMAAVHIDPYGRYARWPGYHVTSIFDYAERLVDGRLTLAEPRLYPCKVSGISSAGA